MATIPYFILGPNTLLALIGLFKGGDKTVPTPARDWKDVKVDVVIPAYNEQDTIILCLESLMRQSLKPHRVILIDDGSSDKTSQIAAEFSEANGIPLEIVKHRKSIGKTPGVKAEARELDGDVEFVLDGDTILESENYIERVVQELYQGAGIASACGTIMPLRNEDRKNVAAHNRVRDFYEAHEGLVYIKDRTGFHAIMRRITNQYREFLYFFLQNFIYRGQMSLYGSIVNPVGCAVAYKREYIKDIFDQYESTLGDNLTTSEDIFIGFALQEMGYRNVQVADVHARSEEPEAQSVPHQVFLWSSAFVQSCYYFPDLLFSPFKMFKRMKHSKELKESGAEEKREIQEAYRQAFGVEHTKEYGRPIGWTIMLALLEKIVFPLVVLVLLFLQLWEPLIITLIAEITVLLILTAIISRQYDISYVIKALLATPMRYATLMYDLYVVLRFVFDILFVKDRKWRK
jgi:glycosyltransferase involved in cell wall biosynthesis